MNTRAYLVGVIDTKEDPPKFLGAGIFSEGFPTLGASRWVFTIITVKGEDFGDAVKKLKHEVRMNPEYYWAARYLDAR